MIKNKNTDGININSKIDKYIHFLYNKKRK